MNKEPEIYLGRPELIKVNCKGGKRCPDFPMCGHGVWRIDCPVCGKDAKASNKFGPFTCSDCRAEVMIAVESWTDHTKNA